MATLLIPTLANGNYPRRIRVTGPMEVQVEESVHTDRKKRRRKKKNKEKTKDSANMTDFIEGGEVTEPIEGTEPGEVETSEEEMKPRILMVRTENVFHEPFESTQETKVHLFSSDHIVH